MIKCCTKKTLTKALVWRLIASATTFAIAYAVDGTVEKAGTIVILDTVFKTTFYVIHEKLWNNSKCLEEHEEKEKVMTVEIA